MRGESSIGTRADVRYFKTTLYGLSGCAPDYVMLMVGGNAGLIGMSKVSQLSGIWLTTRNISESPSLSTCL